MLPHTPGSGKPLPFLAVQCLSVWRPRLGRLSFGQGWGAHTQAPALKLLTHASWNEEQSPGAGAGLWAGLLADGHILPTLHSFQPLLALSVPCWCCGFRTSFPGPTQAC